MTAAPLHWTPERAVGHVAVPGPDSDKYVRGVLAVRTGSSAYPGAAVLGVEAAWRTGVGIVRFVSAVGDEAPVLGLPSPAAAVLAARPETVFVDGATEAGRRADAWLLGSGTDPARRTFAEREVLRRILTGPAPVVVDAGALSELSDLSASPTIPATPSTPAAPSNRATLASHTRPVAPIAITPHRGEFLALWAASGLGVTPPGWSATGGRRTRPSESALVDAALTLADHLGVTVLLKGSLSVAAAPDGFSAIAGPATPWLATAGTGDVLAGILGALAATHADSLRTQPALFGPLAASAAVLHDLAARQAVGVPEGPITALDVARAIPQAIARHSS